ncbi:MAG: hypothetical protein QHI48_09410 [Bacteroidota bacterium]|nr:hypothetical protein [Bacteroidota bacterium]
MMCVGIHARRRWVVKREIRCSLLGVLFFIPLSCTPDEIEGEVLREEWSDYECTAWMRLTSGDIVDVRFLLAAGGRPGFSAEVLKTERLAGKRVRCRLGVGRKVVHCVVLENGRERPLRFIGGQ